MYEYYYVLRSDSFTDCKFFSAFTIHIRQEIKDQPHRTFGNQSVGHKRSKKILCLREYKLENEYVEYKYLIFKRWNL